MSTVKSSKATGYVYDGSRGSWITCYPAQAFIREGVRERRANVVTEITTPPKPGLDQREVDASVWVIVVLQAVSVGYILCSIRWF
jgi:hypothetical protein